MLKQFTIDFAELCSNQNIRLRSFFVLPKLKYEYRSLISLLDLYESGSRPKGGISIDDYGGAISLGGEQINTDGTVDLLKIPYVSYNYYVKSNRGKIKDSDILICKDGALTGKTCLVDIDIFPQKEVMVNEHVYVLRSNKKIKQKLLFYFTTNGLFQSQIKDLAYRKKAQPGLNVEHLKKIKIPLIPHLLQDQIVAQIEVIEENILNLKSQITPDQEVINKTFARTFNFDLKNINKIDNDLKFSVDLSQLNSKNSNLRFSYRWNQLERVQNELYKDNQNIELLGRFILNTKNGWSPECDDNKNGQAILGIDSIKKNGNLSFDNPKYFHKIRNNNDNFIIRDGDFFVSRGNTLDLIALASVARVDNKEQDFIYPDLMIRVKFDENQINKKYMAYLFNSIIGRIYFKYSAKGKNQTMVKISSKELHDFELPIPEIKVQQKIVEEIKTELNNQEEIKQKIKIERNKIDKIIEEVIEK